MASVDLIGLLWRAGWHAAVAAAVVLAARAAVGRGVPGRWRHALWAVVLCRLVLPAVGPTSRASVFGLWPRPPAVERSPAVVVAPPSVGPGWSTVAAPVVDDVPTVRPSAVPSVARPPPRWPAVVAAVWLAGAVGLLGRLVVGHVRFGRRLARTGRPADGQLAAAFEASRGPMRVGRRARVVVTDAVATPAVCGVWRPRVLVPESLADALDGERARLVFLHELAHVRCHDVAVDWAWAVVGCAYWFNPVVWLTGPLRRHDREVARDEMVLSVVGPAGAEAYGRTLLDLARPGVRPAVGVGLVGLFDGRGVRDRVARVARHRGGQRPWGTIIGAVVLAAAGCATLTNPPRPATPPTTAPAAAAIQPVPATAEVVDLDDPPPTPAETAVLAQLDHKLPSVRLDAKKLSDVFDYIRDVTGINLYVDWPSLGRAGISRDAAVTARLRDVKVSKALELIFRSVDGDGDDHRLGYVVEEDVVTVSTRRELDKNTVTRRYDINDLLFTPTDPTQASPANPSLHEATPEMVREQRIDEIKQYVEQNVAPNSWRDNGGTVGSISASPLRAVLLITQTPENHKKIRAVLGSLRVSQGLQVSLEARMVTVADADWAGLPADVRRALDGGPPAADGTVRGSILTPADAAAVVAATGAAATAVPRVTLFSGQRSRVVITSESSYVGAYTAVVRPGGGGTAYEPDVRTTVAHGLTLDVMATVAPDRKYVFVDLHPTVVRLAGLVTEPWAGAAVAGLTVQRPVVLSTSVQTACSVPDGATVLVGCGTLAGGPAVADPAVAAEVDRGRRAHVFLLVRPTAIVGGR